MLIGLAVIAVLLLGGVAAYVIADDDTPDAIATVDGAPLVTDGDEEATDPTVGGAAGDGRAAHDRPRLHPRRARRTGL